MVLKYFRKLFTFKRLVWIFLLIILLFAMFWWSTINYIIASAVVWLIANLFSNWFSRWKFVLALFVGISHRSVFFRVTIVRLFLVFLSRERKSGPTVLKEIYEAELFYVDFFTILKKEATWLTFANYLLDLSFAPWPHFFFSSTRESLSCILLPRPQKWDSKFNADGWTSICANFPKIRKLGEIFFITKLQQSNKLNADSSERFKYSTSLCVCVDKNVEETRFIAKPMSGNKLQEWDCPIYLFYCIVQKYIGTFC